MSDQATNEPGQFFAALLQDHARIEVRLKALDLAAAGLHKLETDASALEVVVGTLRFFASEGARHEANEELTLFPRLRPLAEFKQIVSALEMQHRMNDTEGRQLSACVEHFAPGSGRELRRLAYRFAEMHRGHAFAEERALFPLAAARLGPKLQDEMLRELQQRDAVSGQAADGAEIRRQ